MNVALIKRRKRKNNLESGVLLPSEYFRQDDVLMLSQDLIGKFLMTNIDGEITGGMIVETEAYRAPEDRASHAFGGRRTTRNEMMYEAGGIAYLYRCYGIHSLFNIVTNAAETPHAILIRAIEPTEGIEIMLRRRKKTAFDYTLTSGPGTVSQALGITMEHNGASISGPTIWIEHRGYTIPEDKIVASPRVGIDYAGQDAQLPWRFRLKDNPWTSRPKT